MVKVLFFPCSNYGTWRYTLRKVKRVKCLKCGKMIDIEKAIKQEYNLMSSYEAPKVLQKIKEIHH